jgi:hypothetical protein
MAGYRRQNGKPKLTTSRMRRRREALDARLAGATTPANRVAAAADHLRAALKCAPAGAAERHATEAVQQLVTHASALYSEHEEDAA